MTRRIIVNRSPMEQRSLRREKPVPLIWRGIIGYGAAGALVAALIATLIRLLA